MDAVSTWVKSIIFIVLFAAFLELLLPNKVMKSFVRVVIGFFILLAILQPLVNIREQLPQFFARPFAGINAAAQSKASFAPVKEQREQLVRSTYCKELERQINVMTAELPEISAVKSEIVLKNHNKTAVGEEQIERVNLSVKLAAAPANKIEVNLQDKSSAADTVPAALTAKIIQRLSSFYQIAPEKFYVAKWR